MSGKGPQPLQGPKDWPSAKDEIFVHHDDLKKIAKELQADLDELNGTGKGSLYDLQYNCQIGDTEFGVDPKNYIAAQGLSQSTQNAYNKISEVYTAFLTAYQQVIDSINSTVDNYGKANDQVIQAANQVPANGQTPTNSSGTQQM
jgi:hypothetical protein